MRKDKPNNRVQKVIICGLGYEIRVVCFFFGLKNFATNIQSVICRIPLERFWKNNRLLENRLDERLL
jgi:hypothetical protein